jgi:hypothetical protein
LGGIPGWILASAIAASTTVVMGYAASVWFETGEKLSRSALKTMTQQITHNIVDALRGMGKRRPGKESLKQQIEQALHNMPYARDRSPLDQQAQQASDSPEDSAADQSGTHPGPR